MRTTSAALTAVLLSICFDVPGGRSHAGGTSTASQTVEGASQRDHLDATDTLRDLLAHPAFNGFAPLILPWDDRASDDQLPLARIASLLPYHTHVDPQTVVAGLNRMIDDAADGRTVFYRFYAESQIQHAPAKGRTGLFFFRGRPGAPFALIAPGGGFSYVASVHEGFPYAVAISGKGYNAFVLKYRAGQGGGVATEDMAAAILYILANAASLGVGATGYSLWGSSAGARMAAAIGSQGVASDGGGHVLRPATVVMAYTGHSDYATVEPPTFVVVGEQDGIAPPAVMRRRVEALRLSGAAVEYREYRGVGHGFGLGTGTSAEGWVFDAIRFWETSMTATERKRR